MTGDDSPGGESLRDDGAGTAPDDPSPRGVNLLGVLPWVFLSVAWLALTVAKIAGLASPGALAGVVLSVALVTAGLAGVRRYGTASSAKLLTGGLFAAGGAATLLSAAAGDVAWFPNDVVTVVADVTILSALALVLALKTEAGRAAVAG